MRARVIECVLGTDMSMQSKLITAFTDAEALVENPKDVPVRPSPRCFPEGCHNVRSVVSIVWPKSNWWLPRKNCSQLKFNTDYEFDGNTYVVSSFGYCE